MFDKEGRIMLKGLEFKEVEGQVREIEGKKVCMSSERYKVELICDYTDKEAVKMLVSGYNVISSFCSHLISTIGGISRTIGQSNELKRQEIEEMKSEHKERMFIESRPDKGDLIDLEGTEYVVLYKKFKNGKATYVLRDKDNNLKTLE